MISLIKYRQQLSNDLVEDIESCLTHQLTEAISQVGLPPGSRVGIAVGSRGICNLQRIVKTTVDVIRSLSLQPFILPAMGSHGGATAEGQTQVVNDYGITEEAMNCPIVSSMETIEAGKTLQKTPVYISRTALEADMIIPINRIKPHTLFSGPVESGLMKMTVVGLGKHQGALSFHAEMQKQHPSAALEEMSHILFQPAHIFFGIGVVENSYDQTAEIRLIPIERIVEEEKQLLISAKNFMPHIPCPEFDLLIVDEIGKNISGSGLDPNVVGRYWGQDEKESEPQIGRIFVRNASEKTHGNVLGIGRADFTTARLVRGIDYKAMYANSITSGRPESSKIPIYFETDREVLGEVVKSLGKNHIEDLDVVWIKNTLEISELLMTPQLIAKHQLNSQGIVGEPFQTQFDAHENLIRPLFSFEFEHK